MTVTVTTRHSDELVVVFVGSDGPWAGQYVPSVTASGLNFQLARRADYQPGDVEVWYAWATNPIQTMIRAQRYSAGFHGSITVATFTGADPAHPIGAVASDSQWTGAPSVSLTPTASNSVVWGVGDDWDNATHRTLAGGEVMVHEYTDHSTGDDYWVQSAAARTQQGQSLTFADAGPTSDRWNLVAVEIR
jgi:hypothetical protein